MTPEEVKALSDDALRIRVAELCDRIKPMCDGYNRGYYDKRGRSHFWCDCGCLIPDYTRDLNVMATAELEHIRPDDNKCGGYIQNLRDLQLGHCTTSEKLAFATARQRAEAFVLTLGEP